jgi:hypothetical protein
MASSSLGVMLRKGFTTASSIEDAESSLSSSSSSALAHAAPFRVDLSLDKSSTSSVVTSRERRGFFRTTSTSGCDSQGSCMPQGGWSTTKSDRMSTHTQALPLPLYLGSGKTRRNRPLPTAVQILHNSSVLFRSVVVRRVITRRKVDFGARWGGPEGTLLHTDGEGWCVVVEKLAENVANKICNKSRVVLGLIARSKTSKN